MRKFLLALVAMMIVGIWAPTQQTFAQENTDAKCSAPSSFEQFTPKVEDLENMSPVAPAFDKFLAAHDLTKDDIQDFKPQENMWEPGLFVIELQEELYGEFCLQLLPGYVYTVSLPDGRVEPLWGGDPNLEAVTVLWGFSARWVPAYMEKQYGLGGWLNPEDMTEFLVREHRYGRYLQDVQLEQTEPVPFFNRFGPYYVGTGNVETDWVPPALSAVEPKDFRDAAAMLGGLARENEWTRGQNGVWVWKYGEKKVAGSGDYCPATDPCWQTVYVPSHSDGYVEIWYNGGPAKFGADDLLELTDGQHNVDEFSYHPHGD